MWFNAPPFNHLSSLLINTWVVIGTGQWKRGLLHLFDLRKAFDSVPHIHLINKLSTLNLPSHILIWIHSYLYDWSQVVAVGGELSTVRKVVSGVPKDIWNFTLTNAISCCSATNISTHAVTPPPLIVKTGTPLQQINSVKHLGALLTSDLSWSEHITIEFEAK